MESGDATAGPSRNPAWSASTRNYGYVSDEETEVKQNEDSGADSADAADITRAGRGNIKIESKVYDSDSDTQTEYISNTQTEAEDQTETSDDARIDDSATSRGGADGIIKVRIDVPKDQSGTNDSENGESQQLTAKKSRRRSHSANSSERNTNSNNMNQSREGKRTRRHLEVPHHHNRRSHKRHHTREQYSTEEEYLRANYKRYKNHMPQYQPNSTNDYDMCAYRNNAPYIHQNTAHNHYDSHEYESRIKVYNENHVRKKRRRDHVSHRSHVTDRGHMDDRYQTADLSQDHAQVTEVHQPARKYMDPTQRGYKPANRTIAQNSRYYRDDYSSVNSVLVLNVADL